MYIGLYGFSNGDFMQLTGLPDCCINFGMLL